MGFCKATFTRFRHTQCVQLGGVASFRPLQGLKIQLSRKMGDSLRIPRFSRHNTRVCGLPNVDRALLCTSITSKSVDEAVAGILKGNSSGADVLELRLDFYKDFDSVEQLELLMNTCEVPYIVTYRPSWEGCALRASMVKCQRHCRAWPMEPS